MKKPPFGAVFLLIGSKKRQLDDPWVALGPMIDLRDNFLYDEYIK